MYRPAIRTRLRVPPSAWFGLVFSLLYACYHGILGLFSHSVWFLTMAAYYGIIGIARFSAVLCLYRTKGSPSASAESRILTRSGILLILLSAVVSGVIYLSLRHGIAAVHGECVMITIAAYTFYKITVTVIRAVKHRRNRAPLSTVIRSISYAEVSASVLTLQRSMLASFGNTQDTAFHTLNVLTGAAVCAFVCGLGISLTARGIKRKGE